MLDEGSSLPLVGCFDGKPFGYFEVYNPRDTILGKLYKIVDHSVDDGGDDVVVGDGTNQGHTTSQKVVVICDGVAAATSSGNGDDNGVVHAPTDSELEERAKTDKGIHMLIGEDKFRGPHRVQKWLPALVDYVFRVSPETVRIVAEPRADNMKMIWYLEKVGGFRKIGKMQLPHKVAEFVVVDRPGEP
jgi:hypothetical protein